ncbi:unnamed protein product [Darwinula stevensoni]|uniref:Succinate dehydrogenase assembly factor 2, mitochondrial n=1 Tax=Darwinula stevensoni TaxID=69355 RepID=A0A7R9AHB2_9CRUS|nr:unnamed protein product [Darwinula stevensoni]CAG0904514.1 unnamed protein product [Darwinula stevensoni]
MNLLNPAHNAPLRRAFLLCLRSIGVPRPCYFSQNIESREPPIPLPKDHNGEPVHQKRARLLYQSRKRGMLENGLLLSTFASKYLNSMTEDELMEYDMMINFPSNDWDLYYWAAGVRPVPPEFNTSIMKKFQEHVKNENREERLAQPDLY